MVASDSRGMSASKSKHTVSTAMVADINTRRAARPNPTPQCRRRRWRGGGGGGSGGHARRVQQRAPPLPTVAVRANGGMNTARKNYKCAKCAAADDSNIIARTQQDDEMLL